MKHLSAIFIVMLTTTTFAQFNSNPVIAHRGAWKKNNYPQNSIASLKQAIQLGCYGSEFDVHLTKDDTLVINHDDNFLGIDIARSTYKELLSKKLANGESIPTARQYLKEGMKQKKTKLIFEIKTSPLGQQRTLKLTKMAVHLVQTIGAQNWVEYICFNYEAGKLVHQLNPKAQIAYLNGDVAPQKAKEDGYSGLDYHFSVYKKNPTWMEEAHTLGLSTNSWTVDDPNTMKWLLKQNIDYLTTNEPELLFEIINESSQ